MGRGFVSASDVLFDLIQFSRQLIQLIPLVLPRLLQELLQQLVLYIRRRLDQGSSVVQPERHPREKENSSTISLPARDCASCL